MINNRSHNTDNIVSVFKGCQSACIGVAAIGWGDRHATLIIALPRSNVTKTLPPDSLARLLASSQHAAEDHGTAGRRRRRYPGAPLRVYWLAAG